MLLTRLLVKDLQLTLTPEQRRSLWLNDGSPWSRNRIISARPGTGKTSTLAEYCLSLVQDWHAHRKRWQGMAVISYTNVARAEIERKIVERGRTSELLAIPHFVGTIDAFVNQCIFLPFGSQLMQCPRRPILVGPPSGIWRADDQAGKTCKDANWASANLFDCYSLDLAGEVVRLDNQPRMIRGKAVTPTAVTPNYGPRVRAMKAHLWELGYATQADANYFALQVLIDSPATAKA